jgi:uncharacterized membrane protein
MASSKARSRNRPAPGNSGRAAVSKGPSSSRTNGASSPAPARTQQAASPATAPAGQPAGQPKTQASRAKRPLPEVVVPEPARPAWPPFWLQVVSFVLALGGLGVSIYETWAHFNGSHLLFCSVNTVENCTAVITSPQSMVFNVVPVAILGLVFYVFVVAIMSPWAWRMERWEVRLGRRRLRIECHQVNLVRLATMIAGMGFVMYLLYAELYQIGKICLYCTSVHVITFLLFAITVVCAAIWGLGKPKSAA